MNRVVHLALPVLLASVTLFCACTPEARAFGVNRNGCVTTATNGNAEVVTQIESDDFGGGRRGVPRTTITFAFRDVASFNAVAPAMPGGFGITVEPEGQSDRVQYPWREGWPVVGTYVRIDNVPVADAERIAWFLFVADTPAGEETVYLTFETVPQYGDDSHVTLRGNGWEIPRGVDMLNILPRAQTFELRAVDQAGDVIVSAEFDSSEAARAFEDFARHVPDVQELYEFKVQYPEFECDEEVPL
jgi:hypothetical protein